MAIERPWHASEATTEVASLCFVCLAALTVLMLTGAGCASFSPLLTQEPAPASATTEPNQTQTTDPELVLVEARPNGALLSLRSSGAAGDLSWSKLELLRSRDGEPAIILQEIFLDEAMRAQMIDKGLSVLDRDLVPGHTYVYLLRFIATPDKDSATSEEVVEAASTPVSLAWSEPPPSPGEPSAMALDGEIVELEWQPRDGWGVVIFRRDVLARPPRVERVGDLSFAGASTYIDRSVEPGKVYAYRIAYMREDASATPFYGMPSGEFYVKTPAPPSPPTPTPTVKPEESNIGVGEGTDADPP